MSPGQCDVLLLPPGEGLEDEVGAAGTEVVVGSK